VQQPVEIKVQELSSEQLQAEEDEDEDEEEDEDGDGEDEDEESEQDDTSLSEHPAPPITPRKRPSRELDPNVHSGDVFISDQRSGSPPKRLRKDGTYSPTINAVSPSPARLRKRSSEELEEDDSRSLEVSNGDYKRLKKEASRAPSLQPRLRQERSMTATADVA